MCWECGGCDVRKDPGVLHIVWKGLLVGSPNVPQWGNLGRSRSLGAASHVHPDVSVQETALEDHDAPGVHIALDNGVGLNLDALCRGHRAHHSSAKDYLFRLHITLNDAGATEHDLSRAAD